MAITITQQPNQWNLAYVPNVYVLDGIGTEDFYALQVTIGGTAVATFIQPANPSGVAMFDIQKVLQSYLEDQSLQNTLGFDNTAGELLSYQVAYGHQTAGVITLTGLSAVKHVINGYDAYDVLNWDWSDHIPQPSAFTCISEFPPPFNTNAVYSRKYDFLTNWPTTYNGMSTYKVRSDEHRTLSFFNIIANYNDGSMWGPNESPFFVKISYYNSVGSLIEADIRTITSTLGLGNRVDCNDNTSSVHTDDQFIGTIGVGPWNIQNGPFTWTYPAQTAYYTVQIYSKNYCVEPSIIPDCDDIATLEDYLGYVIYEARFEIEDPCTPFEPINVSFMNQYGVKDYYTFDRRNERSSTTDRNNYTKVLGSWDAASYTISNTDRGNTVFSSDITTTMNLSTYWMSDDESKWMEELFVSPAVEIFYNGVWRPVVITTQTYNERTFNRNRMFQHEITVQFANKKKVQRG